jgi:hypothetical protein
MHQSVGCGCDDPVPVHPDHAGGSLGAAGRMGREVLRLGFREAVLDWAGQGLSVYGLSV